MYAGPFSRCVTQIIKAGREDPDNTARIRRPIFAVDGTHYENTPIDIHTENFTTKKTESFQINILIFFIFLLKT